MTIEEARQRRKDGFFLRKVTARTPDDVRWDRADLACGHTVAVMHCEKIGELVECNLCLKEAVMDSGSQAARIDGDAERKSDVDARIAQLLKDVKKVRPLAEVLEEERELWRAEIRQLVKVVRELRQRVERLENGKAE